jgi:hypothetical protein
MELCAPLGFQARRVDKAHFISFIHLSSNGILGTFYNVARIYKVDQSWTLSLKKHTS